jgi:TPP-dependent pyruvate/acetoin dehydrogenase alpha subunit
MMTTPLTSLTKQDLINFEEDIAICFNEKKIKAPIHLSFGNEDEMIKVFKNINHNDWCFGTWRSHFMCLLKGVPPEQLKKAILDGKSISLCFPEYNVFSSAIVTGILPIALGVALSIKRNGGTNKVYCFVGDMTSETGSMWECFKYAFQHRLPIKFIIEDNGKSVCTDTRKTWKMDKLTFENTNSDMIYYYRYENKWPHAGSGSRIQF